MNSRSCPGWARVHGSRSPGGNKVLMFDLRTSLITEASQVGEARRAVVALAERLGFDRTDAGRVGVVVTEAANNLAKHARDGAIVFGAIEGEGCVGVEVLAIDRGPGMAD